MLTDFLRWLFSSDGFMPHGHCYLWQPDTLWLNVGSDGLIALAYGSIPVTLNYFVRRRRTEIPYPSLFLGFAAFILLCGATHLMEVWTVWHPDYRAAGALKLLTAVVSCVTALALVWVMPRAIQLRSPRELHQEVQARTKELAELNARLQREIVTGEQTQAQLRELDRRKDEFLATLAHELRNPLAPVRTAAQLLTEPGLAATQRDWAQRVIQRQVTHLARLLDDLLDVERITRGKLELKKERVTLSSIVDTAVEASRPILEARHHELVVTLPAATVFLTADPFRLAQVLTNLLTNGAKYTDPGGRIALSAQVEGEKLALAVRDNGVGIAAEKLGQIFGMFSQVEGACARSEGGLGIGLALVRGLVTLHGGEVFARSEGLGRGSEFVLRLPLGLADSGGRPGPGGAAPPITPVGRRVLAVDDNKDAADSLALLLGLAGHEVRVAHGGRTALALAQIFRPEVVLLDLGMPDLDGYSVAQALRREPWGSRIFLIAVSGWGQPEDRQRSTGAGFDAHLTKPVDPECLNRLLAEFRQTKSRSATSAGDAGTL